MLLLKTRKTVAMGQFEDVEIILNAEAINVVEAVDDSSCLVKTDEGNYLAMLPISELYARIREDEQQFIDQIEHLGGQ